MKAISLHPIDYMRVHLHYEDAKARLSSLSKKLRNSTETRWFCAVVLIIGLLFAVALIRLGQARNMEIYYYNMFKAMNHPHQTNINTNTS